MKKFKVNEKAKKIINICCIVCISLLVLFSSFIMVFAGVGACTRTAKADEVQDVGIYEGNNFFVPTSSWNRSGTQIFTSPYFLSVDVKLVLEDYWIANPDVTLFAPKLYLRSVMDNRSKPLNVYQRIPFSSGSVNLSGEFSVLNANYYDHNNQSTPLPSLDTVVTATFWLGYDDYSTSGYSGYYGAITISYPLDFNCNVKAVRYYSTTGTDSNADNRYGIVRRYVDNCIDYIDSNNKVFTLSFGGVYNNSTVITGDVSWEDRLYYLTNSFTDNQYYQNGFNDGEQYGRLQSQLNNSEQLQSEYNRGKDDGITIGKNLGYQEAIDGNLTAGSFFANMLSILDVPIFGFISLGQILMLGVAVSLVMIALKLFAGG